jgi:hypothetical protein
MAFPLDLDRESYLEAVKKLAWQAIGLPRSG